MANGQSSGPSVVERAREGATRAKDAVIQTVKQPMLDGLVVEGMWRAQRPHGYVSYFAISRGGTGKEIRPTEGDELKITRWEIKEDVLEIEVDGWYIHRISSKRNDQFAFNGVDQDGGEYVAIPVRTS